MFFLYCMPADLHSISMGPDLQIPVIHAIKRNASVYDIRHINEEGHRFWEM